MGVISASLAAAAAYGGIAYAAVLAQRLVTYPWWLDKLRSPPPGATDGLDEISIVSCDGVPLSALWRPPLPGRPVVLTLHGIRGYHWVNAARFSRGPWAEAGFGVLAPAFRGYHGSRGWPDERGLLLDAEAAVRFVWEKAPGSPLYIHGHSLGSAVAAATAVRFPCEVLVLESPFTTLPDVGARWYPFLPVRRFMRDVFPTVRLVRQVRASTVVVVHGTKDRLVPFSMGRRVAEAREGAHFVPLDGAGHTGFQQRADEMLLPLVLGSGGHIRGPGNSITSATLPSSRSAGRGEAMPSSSVPSL